MRNDQSLIHTYFSTAFYRVIVVTVRFTQSRFTGSETTGFLPVNLQINRTSASTFTALVTPSEQSPIPAEGNSVYYCVLTEECLTNRWC